MILRPILVVAAAKRVGAHRHPRSAWTAVEATQLEPAENYWLIRQSDHAVLAGNLAARFVSPLFPKLDPEIVEAIGLHDAGWELLEPEKQPAAQLRFSGTGKPLSFFELGPADFVPAWVASIERSEKASPIAALLASGHFCRLAAERSRRDQDKPEDSFRLRDFLAGEAQRRDRLIDRQTRNWPQIEKLVDVLQFCDLVSLYLCSGSTEPVEFSARFLDEPAVRAQSAGGVYQFDPSPFNAPGAKAVAVRLAVKATRYPPARAGAGPSSLPLMVR